MLKQHIKWILISYELDTDMLKGYYRSAHCTDDDDEFD